MIDQLTVFKQDGTRECDPDTQPRALSADAGEIAALKIKVVGEGRRVRLPITGPEACHAPTPWANVFDIDGAGLSRTQLFQLAEIGFHLWGYETAPQPELRAGGADTPFPLDLALAANLLAGPAPPDRIGELVGHHLRVYKKGDPITRDYRRDRINFEIAPVTGAIGRIWFG